MSGPLCWLLRTSVGEMGLFCPREMLATAILTRRNIGWPKGPFPFPDSPFPVARDSMERQRGSLPLALPERKSLSDKQNGAFWQQRRTLARGMQGQRPSFNGRLTIDDEIRPLLSSLRHGRRNCLCFKPLFDSHGADQRRWEELSPWFLRAGGKQMIQRPRGSAA